MKENMVKRGKQEWLVEVVQTVRKYVEGVSQKDAEMAAMEDTWHVGVVEQRVGHSEKVGDL